MTQAEALQEARRRPSGRICNAPPVERVSRVRARLSRGVYHRAGGDYANSGHILFDIVRFAEDLSVSIDQLYATGLVYDQDSSGWKLPKSPSAEELFNFIPFLEKQEAAFADADQKERAK